MFRAKYVCVYGCIWGVYIYICMYTIKYPYVPPHYSKDNLYPHHIPLETLEIPIKQIH